MSFKSMLPFAAIVLGATSLSAAASSCRPPRSFEQGHALRQSQMMSAYNAPAHIDVRGSWDLSFDLSYILWQPRQDNLSLGIANNSATVALPISGNVVDMHYKFKQGFKVGMGLLTEHDNWDVYAEFTMLTGRHNVYSNGPVGGGLLPFWTHPDNVPTSVTSGKSRWRLDFKTVDLDLARSYYVGTKLIYRPYFGGRVALINQKYIVDYTNGVTNVPYQSRNTSTSWAVGPQVGIDANYLLGYGIRTFGILEADVLFTRYNLRVKEQNSANPNGSLAVNLTQRHLYAPRPHINMEMGFGWGTYFANHNYHIDLQASYCFQVFWMQNMFRSFVDDVSVAKSVMNGDLTINGLTATVRLDF